MLNQPDAGTRALAIDVIGQRRMLSAIPALLKAAEGTDEPVRLASLKSLGELAGAAELPAMVGLLVRTKSPQEAQAAEASLAAVCARQSVPAAGKVTIKKAVYGALPDGASADVTKKVAEMVKAGAMSVDASNDNFGDPANGLVKMLRVEFTVDGRGDTRTVNEGETLTFPAGATPPGVADALCGALARAPTGPKLALLRVLRSVGGPKALEAVRAATKDSAAEVKDTALRELCKWPTADALSDLGELARNSADPKVKILAVGGYLRLIRLQDAPADKKLATLKEAMPLAERKDEKRLVLAALGDIPTPEALALVTPYLGDPDLKEEASIAAVAIAEKIVQTHPAPVAEAMQKASTATSNTRLANRAKALLQQAQAKLPRK
jgi:HEAT repeat protein